MNRSKNKKLSNLSSGSLGIKFALLLAALTTFIIPIVILSPLIVAELLGVSAVEGVGLNRDNFGSFVIVIQALSFLVCVVLLKRELKRRGLSWANIGLNKIKLHRALLYVVGYYAILIALFIILAIVAVSVGAGDVPEAPSDQPGGKSFLEMAGGFWQALVLSVVIAPVVEEIVFRGVLFGAIKTKYGLTAAVIGSSAIFTMVHIDPVQMLSALPLGIYLAFVYQKTGSLYPGILLHASWNYLVLVIAQSTVS